MPPVGATEFAINTPTAKLVGATQATSGGADLRGTTPDFAPDDSAVVFAAAPTAGYTVLHTEDLWFTGASIYVAAWDPMMRQLKPATKLIGPAAGSTGNYYYPSFSPDGAFIAFNFAPDGPNFHNPKARVQVMTQGQATATDLTNLNGMGLNNGGNVTNSWSRWSPFVQNYKGGKILWITMSSTRDYGLQIVNGSKGNCYPIEGPMGTQYPPFIDMMGNPVSTCSRTQLWMAAINLDAAKVKAGMDVSYPAFYLPFQDIRTNNHLAQWAQRAYSGTCNAPDGTPGGTCAAGSCCFSGGCAPCKNPGMTVPPPLPAPSSNACSQDANCSTGQCCLSDLCAPCPSTGTDGGAGDGGSTMPMCSSCLDCNGQACNGGTCGGCQSSADCCAPLICLNNQCTPAPILR
jgi:hypothetical protein